MGVSRATWRAAVFIAVSACEPSAPPPAPRPARHDTGTPSPATPAPPLETPHAVSAPDPLLEAYADAPLTTARFDALLAGVAATVDPAARDALVFTVGRRAPLDAFERIWTTVPPDASDVLARALAGRPRESAPNHLPPALVAGVADSIAVASVVSRFRIPLESPPAVAPLLARADFAHQLIGARLLASPSVALPDLDLLSALPPAALTAVLRSLATRTDTPAPTWDTLLRTLGARARLAPRLWANAWRAARDAAPAAVPTVHTALVEATALVGTAVGLPAPVAAALRCENAVALDRPAGWPAATLRCATGTLLPLALAAQAEVLGAVATDPVRRVGMLLLLSRIARGNTVVLESIASAAVRLPAEPARGLLRALASQRDAGVLAALLEGLVLHVQHARLLPPADLRALLEAPYALPEGPALEARVEAQRLASELHLGDLRARASASTIRAVQLAAQPDASIPGVAPAGPPAEAEATIRVTTDAGSFEIALRSNAAPRAFEQIVSAARAHRYDGLTFHRVVPGFVAQGGDPRGDGYGGTDHPVPTELTLQRFDRGAVGVPLAGLDTGGIQFFVVLADAPHLDGRYPWLGTVRSGLDVVDGLLVGDHIVRVELLPR